MEKSVRRDKKENRNIVKLLSKKGIRIDMKPYIPLTALEKTLLHLMEHSRSEEKFEAPIEITQEGISKGTGINVPHVPRAVKKLEEREYVTEKRKNVKGKKQRVKSYYLTNEGMSFAINLKEKLEKEKIIVHDLDGIVRELTIEQFQRNLKTPVTLLEIIRNINGNGKINLKTFYEELERQRSKFVDYTKRAPKLKYFYGRKKELNEIKELFKTHNVVIILGVAGIGKTTLGAKLIGDYKAKKNTFWYQLHEWNTINGLLEPFSEFLKEVGKGKLENYIKTKKSIDLEEISRILENDLPDTNILIIFDDIHKIDKSIAMFFSMLIDLLGRIEGVNVLFLTRYMPSHKLYDYRDITVEKTIYEYQLKGLDVESSRELLESRNVKVDSQTLLKIHEILQGHPLFLELISTVKDLEISLVKETDIRRFIQEEIFLHLSEKERIALSFLSVFRYAVESIVLLNLEEISYEVLEELKEKSLIEEISYDKFDAHDWIKEFFYLRLPPDSKLKYHEIAAQYYTLKKSDVGLIEGAYHFLKAEKRNSAIQLIIENGTELIKKGYSEELKEILDEIDKGGKEYAEYDRILLLKGDLSFALGEWDTALNHYLQAVEISLDEEIRASAYRNIGHIHKERGEWDMAIENYEDALEISERINDYEGMADAHRGIGYIYFRKGIFEGAILYYEECIEYAKLAKDIATNAQAKIDLGLVYEKMEEPDIAIDYYNTSLRLLDAIGDEYQKGRVYNNLGVAYYIKEEWDRALEYWEQCIEISKKTGDTNIIGWALLNASDIYSKKDQFEKALDYLDEAKKILMVMKDNLGLSYVYMGYGKVYSLQNDWENAIKYFNKSIEIDKEMEAPFNLAEKYFEFGKMYKLKGDFKSAKDYLNKALNIYEELEKEKNIDIVKKELKTL